jgi:hypothetical protein
VRTGVENELDPFKRGQTKSDFNIEYHKLKKKKCDKKVV